jgi:outer membrane protein assembly factor BamB
MKVIRLAVLAVFVVSVAAASGLAHVQQKLPPRLNADLTIGVEDGDENLIFKSVSRIDLDKDGRIYALDYKDSKVRIFDPFGKFLKVIPIPAGQGPRELSQIASMAVSPNGLVFLNEMRKVVVFDSNGSFIRSFPLDFNAMTIGNAGDENVIVIGLNNGKIFHVYSAEGVPIRSFADPFEVPAALSEYKDMPMFKVPILFSTSKSGRVFVLNPHRYEISVFADYKLIGSFKGKSDIFEKPAAKGRGFVFPAAYIQADGKRIYVTMRKPAAKSGHEMDIFEDGRQTDTLIVPGIPFVIDAQGRLYFAEEEGYPRIVRYVVEK